MELSHEQLLGIAQQYGTPLYIYNAEQISSQYNRLQNAFKGVNARFFYACKALTNINILKFMKNLGTNLDCVSINEVKLGLAAGFKPKQIMFTPNSVAFSELEEGKNLGVNINIDNISF
ncbi:type III PLP-dependent enzyme domain-containing protein [Arachidicoccus ginsenosidivorans]|uniref:hypothetical protein n=1 Tax=Arachidicoccus ginsenosidivorans TaxID=496057 RepID=UPI0021D170D7|nr:hypothetical protein [Arachidicoccus ginsenosidivorans]